VELQRIVQEQTRSPTERSVGFESQIKELRCFRVQIEDLQTAEFAFVEEENYK
jgi:hypothetical protein